MKHKFRSKPHNIAMLTCAVMAFHATTGFSNPDTSAQSKLDRTSLTEEISPPEKTKLVPPKLSKLVEATCPKSHPVPMEPITGSVQTKLHLNENGQVIHVDILESTNKTIVPIVLEAVYKFRFEPARKITTQPQSNQAIPSQVLYRYTVSCPSPKRSEETQTTVHKMPLSKPQVSTDSAAETPPRRNMPSESSGGLVELPPPETTTAFETIVQSNRVPAEMTSRTVSKKELDSIPGTAGDPLRSIQSLPGVSQTFEGSGEIIVRGATPADTLFFLDEMALPSILHFDSTSVVNPMLIQNIQFYPGNYSVRYGGVIGGIIQIDPLSQPHTHFQGELNGNTKNISLMAAGPIASHWSLGAAGRTNYTAFQKAIDQAINGSNQNPYNIEQRFFDYQVLLSFHPPSKKTPKDTLQFFIFGSDDKQVITPKKIDNSDGFIAQKRIHIVRFHKIQTQWKHRFNNRLSNTFRGAIEYQRTEPNLIYLEKLILRAMPLSVKNELLINPQTNYLIRAGLDVQLGYAAWEAFDYGETYSGQTPFVMPNAYLEFELHPTQRLTATAGLRTSFHPRILKLGADPRFWLRYLLTQTTVIKGGVGLFHQPPKHQEQDPDYGNANLTFNRAIHYTLGVEQKLNGILRIEIEGFYRDLFQLVVPSEPSAGENFNNHGHGKVYGIELLLRHQPTDPFWGWISYTLSNSIGQNHDEQPHPLDYHQTHLLTATFNLSFKNHWQVGARFRLASGKPYTPILGAVLIDLQSNTFMPIEGAYNSQRMPVFHQLDIRIEKTIFIRKIQTGFYLDAQNVYNQRTPEAYYYNYDYSKRYAYSSASFYPNLGIKLRY